MIKKIVIWTNPNIKGIIAEIRENGKSERIIDIKESDLIKKIKIMFKDSNPKKEEK